MACFLQEKVDDPQFPYMSAEVTKLKETEGGATVMCEVMQKYEEIARNEGLQQGMQQKSIAIAKSLLADGMPVELVAKYTNLTPAQVEQLAVRS